MNSKEYRDLVAPHVQAIREVFRGTDGAYLMVFRLEPSASWAMLDLEFASRIPCEDESVYNFFVTRKEVCLQVNGGKYDHVTVVRYEETWEETDVKDKEINSA